MSRIEEATQHPPPAWRIWLTAVRPKTLAAGAAPVILGTAMAFGDGVHHLPSALWALAAAVGIQIGTNLANDYGDWRKGADTSSRLGPLRVMQAGWVAPAAMRRATVAAFGVFGAACVALTLRVGWPLLLLGAACVAAGVFYTAGPRPLGYLGLGEVFVWIFFGPVALCGTYYVQSFEMHGAAVAAGAALGFFSTAILAVNNLRDIPTDAAAGKRTLAVRWGADFARAEYFFCVTAAALIPVGLYAVIRDHIGILSSVLTVPLAYPALRRVLGGEEGRRLNAVLGMTAGLMMVFTLLFAAGWVL